jgi:hypothetical protein
MRARLARWTLRALLILTLLGSALSLRRVYADPVWVPLVTRSAAEIRAGVDRMLLAEATPKGVAARIETRLAGHRLAGRLRRGHRASGSACPATPGAGAGAAPLATRRPVLTPGPGNRHGIDSLGCQLGG